MPKTNVDPWGRKYTSYSMAERAKMEAEMNAGDTSWLFVEEAPKGGSKKKAPAKKAGKK